MMLNGREIDTRCPWEGECFGNQGCGQQCPETLIDVLRESARLEHGLNLTPHNDPDLASVCLVCRA